MYEALGVFSIIVAGLLVIFRVYTAKAIPKLGKRILLFLAVFGVVDGVYYLATWQYPILFHLWSTGILFILLLLIIAGV